MSIKAIALALNELDKAVSQSADGPLKSTMERHIQHMTQALLTERVLSNKARNFRLESPTQIPLTINSYLNKNSPKQGK